MEPQPGKEDVRVVRYTPTEEGVHALNVSYDGHAVPGSPFPVDAQLPPDPSKVTIDRAAAIVADHVDRLVQRCVRLPPLRR